MGLRVDRLVCSEFGCDCMPNKKSAWCQKVVKNVADRCVGDDVTVSVSIGFGK